MLSSSECYEIFNRSIADYHLHDNVDAVIRNPFDERSVQALLYRKNWIDTVQWHLEDIIRAPDINPAEGMRIKRRIDSSNQERTDTVEKIDDYFMMEFRTVRASDGAPLNSETPAWLLDRMSILMLKIWHMEEQTGRTDADENHIRRCREKLAILLEQKKDMAEAFDRLISDIRSGNRRFKVYRQMKMYNDESLNPVLYNRPEGPK